MNYRTATRGSVFVAHNIIDFVRWASSAALSPCMCFSWILLSFCSFASFWPKLALALEPVFCACLLISFTSSLCSKEKKPLFGALGITPWVARQIRQLNSSLSAHIG
ncbi:MAG: hypothetical protein WB713_12630, partial [Methyloceanibacter sp.]